MSEYDELFDAVKKAEGWLEIKRPLKSHGKISVQVVIKGKQVESENLRGRTDSFNKVAKRLTDRLNKR